MDRRLYGDYADRWDNAIFRTWIERRVRKESRVLDIGAGRGRSTEMNMRGKCRFVAGVDPDEIVLENPLLDEARIQEPPDYVIPFDDGSFDVVFCNSVLEHVADVNGFFTEVNRVLTPGGRFLAKTPNHFHYVSLIARFTPHRFHEIINRLRGRVREDTFPTLYRCNSRHDVNRALQTHGLCLSEFRIYEGRPEYLRINSFTYLCGFFYERLVNAFDWLEPCRCVIVFEAQKNRG